MERKYCIEHSKTKSFLDSITDEEVIRLWFSQRQCHLKGCDETCHEIKRKAEELATLLLEVMPNRGERLVALRRLQEVCFWSCEGLKRVHAVNNILQVRQGQRDLSEARFREEYCDDDCDSCKKSDKEDKE
jgi:hypothetical protein